MKNKPVKEGLAEIMAGKELSVKDKEIIAYAKSKLVSELGTKWNTKSLIDIEDIVYDAIDEWEKEHDNENINASAYYKIIKNEIEGKKLQESHLDDYSAKQKYKVTYIDGKGQEKEIDYKPSKNTNIAGVQRELGKKYKDFFKLKDIKLESKKVEETIKHTPLENAISNKIRTTAEGLNEEEKHRFLQDIEDTISGIAENYGLKLEKGLYDVEKFWNEEHPIKKGEKKVENNSKLTLSEKILQKIISAVNSKYTLDNVICETSPEGNVHIMTRDGKDICTVGRENFAIDGDDTLLIDELRENGYWKTPDDLKESKLTEDFSSATQNVIEAIDREVDKMSKEEAEEFIENLKGVLNGYELEESKKVEGKVTTPSGEYEYEELNEIEKKVKEAFKAYWNGDITSAELEAAKKESGLSNGEISSCQYMASREHDLETKDTLDESVKLTEGDDHDYSEPEEREERLDEEYLIEVEEPNADDVVLEYTITYKDINKDDDMFDNKEDADKKMAEIRKSGKLNTVDQYFMKEWVLIDGEYKEDEVSVYYDCRRDKEELNEGLFDAPDEVYADSKEKGLYSENLNEGSEIDKEEFDEFDDHGMPIPAKPYQIDYYVDNGTAQISSVHPYDLTDYSYAIASLEDIESGEDNVIWTVYDYNESGKPYKVGMVEDVYSAVDLMKELDSKKKANIDKT